MKKKLIILLLIAAGVVGCETPDGEREEHDGYDILIIDSCQYIEVKSMVGSNNGYYSLTHKGNCNNPFHYIKHGE